MERAAEVGLTALAPVDRRTALSGCPTVLQSARAAGVRPIVGAQLTLPRARPPLLVESRIGYRNLPAV